MNDLNKINFWKRLESFIKNIEINSCEDEEEKEMILHICKQNITNKNYNYNIDEIQKLIKRIDIEINKNPTGILRNLLCDTNIMLYQISLYLLNNSI